MTHRFRLVPAALAALALVPAIAAASPQSFHCGLSHYLRSGGTEIVGGVLAVRNADAANPAAILRLTIRDSDGNVVHDSGPQTGIPLPLNTDFPAAFPAGKDISRVAPGGSAYLRTGHLWGTGSLPAGNEVGQALSATVVVAKEGPKGAINVSSTQRIRTRAAGSTPGSFVEVDTRAQSTLPCEPIR